MKALLKKLSESEGLKSSAIVTFGNLGGTAISAIALIILSRFLGPDQFGVFSVGFSLLLILNRAGDLGINLATQRYLASKDNPQKQTLIQSVFVIKTLISLLILGFGLIFSNYLATHFLHLENSLIIKFAFLSSVAVIYFEYVNTIIQSLQYFTSFAVSILIQALLKILGVITMIVFSFLSPANSVILYGLTPLISGLVISFTKKLDLLNLSLTKKIIITDLKIIAPTIKWTSLAVIAAALADNIDVLIVQNLLNSTQTGIFSAGVRLATFVSLIGLSIGIVLNIRVAKYTTKNHLDKYLAKAKWLALLSFFAILLLTPFSRLMLLLTAGSSYLEGTATLVLLLISTAFLTATAPYVSLFFLYDKPQYFAISGILTALILIISDFFLINSFGILGAGYARIITRASVLVFTLIYAKTSYKQHLKL